MEMRRGWGHDLRYFVLYIQFNYQIYMQISVLPNIHGHKYIEYTYQQILPRRSAIELKSPRVFAVSL